MSERIPVTADLFISESDIAMSFVRSSGPGGQNVNKVASAVQLRFDLAGCESLPQGVKSRAARLAGSRLTTDGAIVIAADTHRSQHLNREAAVGRLVGLLRRAAAPRKRRIPTKPTLASKRRRVDAKKKRGATKQLRRSKPTLD